MTKKIYLISLLFMFHFLISCNTKNEIEVYDFNEFKSYLNKDDNRIHIIHFWATWCVPCLKELPEFVKFYDEYNSGDIVLILVSLDFPEKTESELIPFIKEYNITPEVIILDDPDQNYWINEISPDWSGSIPATLIYTGDERRFYERSLTYNELVSIVQSKG